jgi:carbon-monoxide dehydrogenase medium subunit
VKPAPLEYRRAESVEEAVALLAEAGPDAKVLAGGQSFVPMLNMRMARPALLVDVNRVAGLDGIAAENGHVRVGATCRQRALERSALARERCPLLAACLPFVGHVATRNRGTVGGSVAHADAAAELPLALVALGGSVVAESRAGRRSIPAEELFVSHFTTALEPDELLVETVWPAAPPGAGYAFEELALRHGDYALSMAACALRVEGGAVAEARLALGAVASRPTLVDVPLAGRAIDADAAREAGEAARAAVAPRGHLHASVGYLRHVTGVLAERAVLRAWEDAA